MSCPFSDTYCGLFCLDMALLGFVLSGHGTIMVSFISTFPAEKPLQINL